MKCQIKVFYEEDYGCTEFMKELNMFLLTVDVIDVKFSSEKIGSRDREIAYVLYKVAE